MTNKREPVAPSGSFAPFGAGRGMGNRQVPGGVRAQHTAATLARIWQYMKRQHSGLLAVCVLAIVGSALSLVAPYLLGVAMDRYIMPGKYEGLLTLCLLLLAVYVFSNVFSWLQAYIMSGVTQRTVSELREDVFAHLQKLPLRFFDKKTHGELMSRTTNDMETISNSLNQSIVQFISSLVMITGALGMMLALNVWLTFISLLSIPLVTIFTCKSARYMRTYFKEQQQYVGEVNGFAEEMIAGQKVVTLFHREEQVMNEFSELNTKLKKASIRAQILSGTVGPVMNMVNNLSFALLAAAGGWLVLTGGTSVGVIVSFLTYSKQFGRPVNELANQYNLIQSGIAGAERVFELLDTRSEYEKAADLQPVHSIQGDVQFRNVSFSYKPGTPILSDVTFTAKPGEMIALVGPTGAGKTTIVNLLTRFYDIDQGDILLDGQTIRSLEKDSLRRQLGMVLQDAYLFSDTIRENIRYGRLEATDEDVEAVARFANAHEFIRKLPHGYDTVLSAEGHNISHGQRQLLTIARAILADPAILILDEATSSIDTRTEMQIQAAMTQLMKGRTSFVIAHRLRTVQDANLILVLQGGRIVERGTHDQLLSQKGVYYELYHSQFEQAL